MSRRLLIGTFAREEDVLGATSALVSRGHEVLDVYAPYPVHGLDEAMGLAPSRLTWACFACGLAGLAAATALQVWTSAYDWPLDVGGKPLLSLPAFVPIAFELTVLFGGLGAFFLMFARAGLYPGRAPRAPVAGITDDRFAVVVLERDAAFSAFDVRELLAGLGALEVSEREEGDDR